MSEPPPSAPKPLAANLGAACVLFVVTLFIYWPVHSYEFITLDDGRFVVFNPHVNTGLTAANVKWAFTSAEIDYWRPLSWLSHQLDVEIFGLNAGRHHLTSVLIHAVNVVLVFALVMMLFGHRVLAFFVAALFGWHPIHVESVAWIAERKDVLCGLFWITTLMLYVRYAQTDRTRLLIFAGAAYVGGVMCKPMIITLPFQLLLLDIWPLNRLDVGQLWHKEKTLAFASHLTGLVREKALFFVVTFVICEWTVVAQKEANAMTISEHVSILDRLGNSVVGYGRYLKKLVLPNDLAVFYPYPPDGWPAAAIAGCLALLVGISVFAIQQLRRRPFLFVGWAWFIGSMLPIIGIIQVGSQSMADRYTYMPALGIYLAAMVWILGTKPGERLHGAAIVGLALILLTITTRSQVRTWQNTRSAFSHAISVTEDNWLAMNNLANDYSRSGEWNKALPLFTEVARLFPGNAESFYNLALAQAETGRFQEAGANYLRCLEQNPIHAKALQNLGHLLADPGKDHAGAIVNFRRALEIEPGLASAKFGLASSLKVTGERDEAARVLEELIREDPAAIQAVIELAQMNSEAGRVKEGLALLEASLQQNPDSGYLAYNAGSFAATLNDGVRAEGHLRRALAIAETERDQQLFQASASLLQQLERR